MSNKRPLPIHEEDRGVSTVLGAVLVSALVVMVLVTVRVNFVPQWDEADDAEQIQVTSGAMAQLRSALDRQLDDPTASAVTVPIQLSGTSTPTGFFSAPRQSADLNFRGAHSEAVNMTAPNTIIRAANQGSLAGINEQWIDAGSGAVNNVNEVNHLRLRITNPFDESNDDGITLTITDADGNFAGSLRFYVAKDGSSVTMNSAIKNADNVLLFDSGESAHHNVNPPYAWLNALDPNLFFDQVLSAAKKPMTLTLSEQGLVGDYAMTYVESTPGGPATVGQSGVAVANYVNAIAAGRLEVTVKPSELPEQILVYEHGAVFRIQHDGQAVYIPPNIRFLDTNNGPFLELDLPMLSGAAASRTGGAVPAQFVTESRVPIQAVADTFTITIATAYPELWERIFANAATNGGVPSGHFSIVKTSSSVIFTIVGPSATPADYDVSVKIRQASIKTTFQS